MIATDACPKGYGGTRKSQYFQGRFPQHLQNTNIPVLEMMAVLMALKIWGSQLKGSYFWIHVDNEAVAVVLNSGASKDIQLQNLLREIALLAAQHQLVIKARHISGISNRVPDWLSRWHEPEARKSFWEFAKDNSLTKMKVSAEMLGCTNEW